MPSAVRRLRSHAAQNGSVVDAMMPNVVPSGSRKRSAGAESRPGDRLDRRRSASVEPREHLARATRRASIDQCVAPPTSMYSMNRTSAPTRPAELEQRHAARRR